MKVSGDWLTAPATQAVCAMLTNAGYQALFVGGCVRNALLNAPVNDIDISTDARPQQVIDLARAAGLNAVPTGIDHGTITVISDHIAHEITTFRKDVETDGRRAVVAFSDHVEDDAKRRDFTMNALYARPDGTVVDPLGGMDDLRARRVRFIDDATQRIREDYLRILRYFRFHAWYGDADAGMDPDALSAIAQNIDGLDQLSRERVGTEMLKLLAATNPAPAVAAMRSCGGLGAVITGADDKALAPLVHLQEIYSAAPDTICRLAALGGQDVPRALRLSKKNARQHALLREQVEAMTPTHALGYCFGDDMARAVVLLRAALIDSPVPLDFEKEIMLGSKAVFPIKPQDLMPALSGPDLGAALKLLEQRWLDSRFSLQAAELIASLP